MDAHTENFSNKMLQEIREKWLQTEGAKGLFGGTPYDEVEAYFNFSYFQLSSRLLHIETFDDRQRALREITQIKKELELCSRAFDYFVKMKIHDSQENHTE
jgi:hypothetical protein